MNTAPSKSVYADATREVRQGPLLGSRNRLKFAVFSPNVQRGTTGSLVPETLKVTWPDTVAVARAAEDAGIEAVIPLARWRRAYTAEPEADRIFETFTWAAGIAASTQRIQVFATVHMPLIHPVMAAKQAATIDHISNGRFGINVVAGWNTRDFDMFGYTQHEHDDRYAAAAEWMQLAEKLWVEHEPFDFQGQYYQGKHLISQPKPVQAPRPAIMSAGSSGAGKAFAQRWADVNFIAVPNLEKGAEIIAKARGDARALGREIGLYTNAWIVCRDTEREAKDYVEHVIQQHGDWAQANLNIEEMIKNSHSISVFEKKELAARAMQGFFSLPLIGTPDQIVERLLQISKAGLDGLAISWVDYHAGLAQFKQTLLPLMIQAGLRVA